MRRCLILLAALAPLAVIMQASGQSQRQTAPSATSRQAPAASTPVVRPDRSSQPERPRSAAAGGAAAATALPAVPTRAANPAKGNVTGLPLPRFAALRADEVNMRAGPGTRYPVEWVYKRRDLPVEIMREFEVWRLVRDPDGVQGWVHAAVLTGRRSFVVRGEEQVMRRAADPEAAAVARLEGGVVGRVRGCEANAAWCQVQVGDHRGFLPRTAFWGTYQDEAIN